MQRGHSLTLRLAVWNQFANDTCLPDASSPCSSAGYPAYVVNATSAKDVKAAVDFGKKKSHHPPLLSSPRSLARTCESITEVPI